MTIFFLKSLLSLMLLAPAVYGMYTMFKVFGGGLDSARPEQFRHRHRAAGYLFILIFLLVSFLCVSFMAASRSEPSPRAALHILLALTIAALLIVKVLFVRSFRQLYAQAKVIGTVIGIMSVVLVGMSAGYYLTISRFGRDLTADKSVFYRIRGPLLAIERTGGPGVQAVRTDRMSVERGRTLFASRCAACHDPLSTNTIVGPGLKGLLKNPTLPVSKHPATAESIRFQLRQPMGRMPSFAYLSDEEMEDLIAYLNTL
ncbi:MAG TPA: cytochrome c [Nitrospirota bacterium]|nr:cytochrome c [Nitrospirota bacterium]